MKHHQYPPIKDKSSMVREARSVQFHKTRYIFFPEPMNEGVQERVEKRVCRPSDDTTANPGVLAAAGAVKERSCSRGGAALARWEWPDGQLRELAGIFFACFGGDGLNPATGLLYAGAGSWAAATVAATKYKRVFNFR